VLLDDEAVHDVPVDDVPVYDEAEDSGAGATE
jgi:hypothetical protein